MDLLWISLNLLLLLRPVKNFNHALICLLQPRIGRYTHRPLKMLLLIRLFPNSVPLMEIVLDKLMDILPFI